MNYIMWGVVGIYFNIYVYQVHKTWWARYVYVMSVALIIGIVFMAIFIYFTLQGNNVPGPWWGMSTEDHCSLATCPIAPGIVVEGCHVH